VLARKFASPVYWAVSECMPAVSVLIFKVAWRLVPSVAIPRLALPSKKVTDPVGVTVPGATTATVAVRVTVCPTSDGFTLEVRLVVVKDGIVIVNPIVTTEVLDASVTVGETL